MSAIKMKRKKKQQREKVSSFERKMMDVWGDYTSFSRLNKSRAKQKKAGEHCNCSKHRILWKSPHTEELTNKKRDQK